MSKKYSRNSQNVPIAKPSMSIGGNTLSSYRFTAGAKNHLSKNKYDIPVGCLVFAKTINPFHGLDNYWNPQPSITNYPKYWAKPWNPLDNTVQYGYSAPVWTEDQTITTGWPSGKNNKPTTSTVTLDSKTEQSLNKLYKAYVAKNGGGSNQGGQNNNGGNTLGMSTMGGKKAKKQLRKLGGKAWKNGKKSNHKNTTSNNATVNYNKSNLHQLQSIIQSGTATTKIAPEYILKGYKTASDCLGYVNPITVEQKDGYSEEELQKSFEMTGQYPETGKPFNCIVVDKFSSVTTTECGEKVNLPQQTLYKVLISENQCLWVDESFVSPMKPEECPVKEGWEDEIETE